MILFFSTQLSASYFWVNCVWFFYSNVCASFERERSSLSVSYENNFCLEEIELQGWMRKGGGDGERKWKNMESRMERIFQWGRSRFNSSLCAARRPLAFLIWHNTAAACQTITRFDLPTAIRDKFSLIYSLIRAFHWLQWKKSSTFIHFAIF